MSEPKPINLRATCTMSLRNEGLFTEEIASFWHIIESNFPGSNPIQMVQNFLTTFRIRVHNAERRSHYRGQNNFQINLCFLLRLYVLQKGRCFYNSRIILQPNRSIVGGRSNHVVSIERLAQEQDYTLSNTVLCSLQYNTTSQMTNQVFQDLVRGETLIQPNPVLLLNNDEFMKTAKPFLQQFVNKYKSKTSYAIQYSKQSAQEQAFSSMKLQEKRRKFCQENEIDVNDDDSVDSNNDDEEEEEEKEIVIGRKFVPQVYINVEHLYQLYDKQHGRCAYSHHPLLLASGSPFSCSVERIDNLKHYEEGNCFLVCLCMQAGHAKWTRESFIADHSYWLQNFDALLQTQQQVSTMHLHFATNYPPKESAITAQSLPRFIHSQNDGTNICQFCNDGQSFSSFKYLNQHKIDLHPETMFACPHPSCRMGSSSDSQHRFFLEPCLLLSHYVSKHNEKNADGLSVCNFEGCNTPLGGGSTVFRHISKQHKNRHYEISAQLYNNNNAKFVYLRPTRQSIARVEERKLNKKRTLGID